jgi:para-nitrobenzyl esterase
VIIRIVALCALLSSAAASCFAAPSPSAPIVQTQYGPVEGRSIEAPKASKASSIPVAAYKGLPYAVPPVGALRWQPPQPPRAWTGVKDAGKSPPGCMQPTGRQMLPWTEEFRHVGNVSEDCLYLNVWTAAREQHDRLPVLVWIHGGAYTEGSVSVPLYDGAALARKGLVVVTINYRLGALGFLAHPELVKESPHQSSGNYGLLDQIAALQWVQANIASFGGDANRVTIAGQSAGAMAAYLLTASPLAAKLFHRVIEQSGPGAVDSFSLGPARSLALPREEAERRGAAWVAKTGARSIKEARELDASRLLGPADGPSVDGWVLPAEPRQIYSRGKQHDVPWLIGMTADEATAFPGYEKSQAPALRREGLASLHTLLAERAKTSRTPAFEYYFERAVPWPEHPEYGAFHSGELPYMFDNLDKMDRPWKAADRALADAMSSYWANFVANGNPNSAGLPGWPTFDPETYKLMALGDAPAARVMAPGD